MRIVDSHCSWDAVQYEAADCCKAGSHCIVDNCIYYLSCSRGWQRLCCRNVWCCCDNVTRLIMVACLSTYSNSKSFVNVSYLFFIRQIFWRHSSGILKTFLYSCRLPSALLVFIGPPPPKKKRAKNLPVFITCYAILLTKCTAIPQCKCVSPIRNKLTQFYCCQFWKCCTNNCFLYWRV